MEPPPPVAIPPSTASRSTTAYTGTQGWQPHAALGDPSPTLEIVPGTGSHLSVRLAVIFHPAGPAASYCCSPAAAPAPTDGSDAMRLSPCQGSPSASRGPLLQAHRPSRSGMSVSVSGEVCARCAVRCGAVGSPGQSEASSVIMPVGRGTSGAQGQVPEAAGTGTEIWQRGRRRSSNHQLPDGMPCARPSPAGHPACPSYPACRLTQAEVRAARRSAAHYSARGVAEHPGSSSVEVLTLRRPPHAFRRYRPHWPTDRLPREDVDGVRHNYLPPVSGNGTTANSTQAEQPQTERACARGTDAAQLPSARWPWSGRVPERIPKGKRDKPSRQSKKAKPQARRNLESSRRSIDRRWIDKLFHFRVHFRPGSARVCCAVPPCFTDAGGRGSATVFLPKSRRSVDERVHGIHGSPVVVQPRRIREWAANKHPQQQQPPALGQMPTVRGDRWPKVKAQLAARPIAKYTGKGAHTSPLLLAPPTKPLAMRDTRRHAMCHARVAAFAAAASRLIGRAPRRDCPRGSDRIHPFINWAFSISQWEATASASPGAPPGPLRRWPPDQSLVALPPAISGPHQQPHGQLMSLARPPVPPPRRRRRRRRRRGLAPMPWTVVKNERLSRSLCGRAPRVSARASS
ncbi:hypothetical protein PCL_04965 [Purpureocillium lilacinum]|uniref:Uncharacterized protein n=1 Tax=Purpureocillium lilacinum TaxID=33203 RepID=A0A2U3DWD8_PURLI|nr:hypothetical protein PCL_04965 [Purpureocillium lilacinum]